MAVLENKIDFALVFSVKNANPNGDPLSENMPRTTLEGYSEVSDVCLKRKIRNRLLEAGNPIFVQSDDNRVDEYRSLLNRAKGVLGNAAKSEDELRKKSCETWLDVRSFGQVFAYKGDDKTGISVGIRGPVSIQSAFSVTPVNVTSMQITKSVSGEGDGSKRGSDTMGMKHRVDFGLYVTYGSINPQLAEKTGFSAEDAEQIKNALLHIFDNDASSARPEGSMEVISVYWWKHNCKSGQYSAAKVHRSLRITAKTANPKAADDFDIIVDSLDGLKPEILSF
ncbi:type I-C CRISPR-associated protein Cas7/Csd2 [Treponema brennaborense]|uniref:CRISPR-associated protein, Csd2 family n=1 Tax=Treponema brennaborense (strain DSM 12168 / CIP 105900 / DD5/3) TaxID=906968 RepID=F4LKN4_TREBD|nr:type I-C CRISPR-associated protein Cas7/Csd2 [Treponema brennaborense]AEE17590.1 CRISPR-associated protein, Csd2 family [Treponema brennaborense DSM 12168]